MKRKEFYIHLGRVLYAVAKADGAVQDEEVKKMYELISGDLSEEELFEEAMDEDTGEKIGNAFHTEFEFEELREVNADMHSTFNSFIDFIDENHSHFTKKMKESCVKAAKEIATAYEGIVPAEQEVIDKLQNKVNEL